ncbi:MAG: CoA transferase [Dehalococcoidia bacterium]|nr:CoA transferase [Dehalococcoidia bacterium]
MSHGSSRASAFRDRHAAPMELLAGERFDIASHGIAAAYAAWLLRELGADVRHETSLDPEGPGTYPAEGATLAARPSIAAGATNVVTDMPVTDENRRFLDGLATSARLTWITPWGLDNPWSKRPSTDLCAQAAGGWMSAVGEPDREPIGPPDSQASFIAGLFAAVNALRHHASDSAGPGLSDISIVESVSATTIYDPVAFQYLERIRPRIGKRFGPAQPTLITLPCKDGYVGIHAALHGQWLTLAKLIGHPELVEDPRFASPQERAAHTDELDAYILPWLAKRTRFEAYHELQQARIPASATPSIPEVLASPQLEARGAWREVTHPSGKRVQVPGQVVRTDDVPDTAPTSAGDREDGPWQAGKLRVVDLSMGWAGPMVSHILAGLGADVIKIESHTHFDWWRGSRPPGDDPSLALHERSHVFNGVNRGKRGVTLNLQTQAGAELGRQLIGSADVVVENFGAGVVERLGLSYDTLKALNPGLIMLQQPGFGTGGPGIRAT